MRKHQKMMEIGTPLAPQNGPKTIKKLIKNNVSNADRKSQTH